MPDTVYLLGNNVFAECGNIKSIYFSNGLQYIYANTFDGISLYDNDGVTPINVLDINAVKGHTFSGPSYNYLIKDNYTVTVIVDEKFISNTREIIGNTINLYEKVGYTIQWEVSPSSLVIDDYSFVMPSENVTLRGTSTPNKYTVSVFLNGGSIDEIPDGWTFNDGLYTKDCDYGTEALLIERMFANVYKIQSDVEWIATSDTVTTYGLELTAKWVPKQYMITWCNEDGTILLQSKVEYGTVPRYTETAPTKDPTSTKVFAFIGWDTEPSEVEGEKTYHATYEEFDRYYSIYADINGDITEVKTKYGEIPELPAEPSKPSTVYLSYTFEYWSPSVQNVTCDMTYVAVFSTSPREYTVTWVDDEGNILDTTTGLTYGSTPQYTKGAVTKEPTAEFSYTFINWTPQVKTIIGDTTYTAVFESIRNTYTVTWKDDSGKTLIVDDGIEYGSAVQYNGETPTKPQTAQYTYVFSGWDGMTAGMMVESDLTFTAKYTPIERTYTVIFNAEGNITSNTLKYGETIIAPEDPTKETDEYFIYTFSHWIDYYEGSTVTQDVTYTASFSTNPHTYTVTWTDDEGKVLDVTDGLTYGSIPKYTKGEVTKTPTAEFSYTFVNWTPQIKAISGDATYEAVFEPTKNKYSVTWKDDSGKVLAVDDGIEYGSAVQYSGESPVKSPTAQYTYSFAGWDGMTAGMMVESDLTFTAKYTPIERTYTVIFNAEGNITSSTLKYGEKIIAPEDPAKESDEYFIYTFSHWIDYYEGSTVTNDVTYTASFSSSPHTYTVTWVDDEGNVLDITAGLTYGSTPQYTKENVTKAPTAEFSYTFVNWTPQIKAISGDATYTAVFEPTKNKYTVTWKDDSGKVLSTEEDVEYGSAVQYKGQTPVKSPTAQYTYSFAGWDGMTAGMIVESDITFTAKYFSSDRTYTITFNAEGNITSSTMKYGDKIIAPENPTKESDEYYIYTFSNWTDYYEGSTATQDMTFYANFSSNPHTYTVTWVDDEGNILDVTDGLSFGAIPAYTKGDVVKKPTAEFSYTFTNWTPQIKAISGDATYTALFEPIKNTYTIMWKDDSGKVLSTEEDVEYGSAVQYKGDTPIKSPTAQYTYVFAGWNGMTAGMIIESDIIFTAKYVSYDRMYTVSFNADGDIISNSLKYGDEIVAPKNPTKESDEYYNYTFSHWIDYYEGSTVTQDVMYYAQFDTVGKDFHIVFSTDDKKFYEYDGSYGSLVEGPRSSPMKEADAEYQYVFIGWDGFFKGITKITGDMEFKAVFSQLAITHLIQFTVDDRVVSVYSLPFGSEIIAPENPVKATTDQYEYTFLSWGTYYKGMKVTGPMTFEAQFYEQLRMYDITFKYLDKESTVSYGYGETIVAPADPVKPSDDMYEYTFSHWNGFNEGMTVTGKAVFTAIFEKTVKSLGTGNIIVLTVSEEDLLSLSEDDIKTVVSKMGNDDGSFSLDTGNGTIKFDSGSVKSFKWEDVKASVEDVSDQLSESQKKKVGDRPVYDVTLSNKDGTIHQLDSGDEKGSVEITVEYELKDNEDPNNLSVWYLDGDELTEKKNCKYHEENGKGYVTFKTEHLSNYAIMYTEQDPAPEQNSGNDSTINIGLIAGICIAIIAVCAVGFVIYKRH